MRKVLGNTTNKIRQYSLVLVAVTFVLWTSCPIKISIKNLIGIPVNTEQEVPKGKYDVFDSSSMEKCPAGPMDEVNIAKNITSNSNYLLPAVILTSTFRTLSILISDKEKSPHLYCNIKVQGDLPIFIQYRKLII